MSGGCDIISCIIRESSLRVPWMIKCNHLVSPSSHFCVTEMNLFHGGRYYYFRITYHCFNKVLSSMSNNEIMHSNKSHVH